MLVTIWNQLCNKTIYMQTIVDVASVEAEINASKLGSVIKITIFGNLTSYKEN